MSKLPPSLRRTVNIVGIVSAVVLLVIGVSLFSIYEASQSVPQFYHDAVSKTPDEQTDARDQFVAQATAMASDLHAAGHWQTLFTADQINAWLALELAATYPDILPKDMRDPRIAIRDHEATIACRFETGDMATVLSLTIDAYLHEPNVLALRIRRARAGALPVPLAQVLDGIAHAASELNLRLEWRKIQGDPVALIHLVGRSEAQDKFNLQNVELRDGELFLAGTNRFPSPGSSPTSPKTQQPPTAQADGEDSPVVGSAEKETVQK